MKDFTAKAKAGNSADPQVFDKLHEAVTKKGGGVCRSDLYIDALNVHKYYPHECEVKIELIRNPDDFLLMYDPQKTATIDGETLKVKYAIKLKKFKLHYKIIRPSKEIKQEHEQAFSKGLYAMIPFAQTDLSHRLILPLSSNYQLHRIVKGPSILRKIFVMFLDHDNYTGQPNFS